jgi:hypothetical protein
MIDVSKRKPDNRVNAKEDCPTVCAKEIFVQNREKYRLMHSGRKGSKNEEKYKSKILGRLMWKTSDKASNSLVYAVPPD